MLYAFIYVSFTYYTALKELKGTTGPILTVVYFPLCELNLAKITLIINIWSTNTFEEYIRHGAKNVRHGAKNVHNVAKNVHHGAENVHHGAKTCVMVPKMCVMVPKM